MGSYSPADEDVNGGDNNGTEMVFYTLYDKHYTITQCDKELRIKHNFFAVYPILDLSSIDVCFDIFVIKHRKNCECCPGHYLSTSVY